MNNEFHYDTVRYPSSVFSQFRPDKIGAIGILHGLTPDRIEDCRVLELGCGDGNSLLSIASSMPGSTCVGVDLSKSRIAEAKSNAELIGLSNIEFHHLDVMELAPGRFGEFDFVIAHGLFSWIPDVVREKLLEIYKTSLARNGIGFISYNAYPGWRIRSVFRDAGRFASGGTPNGINEAESILDFIHLIAASAPPDSIYAKAVDSELKAIEGRPLEVLFHDDLAEQNQPFYFSEFASMTTRAGLAFIAEADPVMQFTGKLAPDARELLNSMSSEPIRREQCFDFLRGTRFRQSLVCHTEASPNYFADPSFLDHLYFSSGTKPTAEAANFFDDSTVEFSNPQGSTFSTNFGFTKAFLKFLASRTPVKVTLPEFLSVAQETFQKLGNDEFRERSDLFRMHVLDLIRAGVIEAACFAPKVAESISDRPETSAFARWQIAQDSPYITMPDGRSIPIASDLARQLVLEFDGSRTIAEVAARLGERNPSAREEGMLSPESLLMGTEQLLKYGVFVS